MIKFIFFLLCICFPAYAKLNVLICGVGQNVGNASSFTIKNIEELGKKFGDYRVIIYENNSEDHTVNFYSLWAKRNPRVTFLTETIRFDKMPQGRMPKIARARNCLLKEMAGSKYEGFEIVVMVDLDFVTTWPIIEIVRSASTATEWDCISANGIDTLGNYYDRVAFRSVEYPLGPELLGDMLWREEIKKPITFTGKDLIPVYSAFGGLALYKRKTLLAYQYSGQVTEQVKSYYQHILTNLNPLNPQIKSYMASKKMSKFNLLFSSKQCCEHLTMHAQMALDGHGKFYINPNMHMRY